MSASQHLDALFDHVGDELIDYVIVNRNNDARRPPGWRAQPVEVDVRRLEELPGRHRRGGRHRPRKRPPPRPGEARRGAHAAPAGGPGRAAAPTPRRPPDRQRLLTAAVLLAGEVKGELARIQPARACDRRAELIGLLHGRAAGLLARSTMPRAHRRPPRHLPRDGRGSAAAVARTVRAAGGTTSWSRSIARRSGRGRGTAPVPATGARSFAACSSPRLDLVRRLRPARRVRPRRRGRRRPCSPPSPSLDVRALTTERRGRHVVYLKGQEEIVALLRSSVRTAVSSSSRRTAWAGTCARGSTGCSTPRRPTSGGRSVRPTASSAIARLEAEGRLDGLSTASARRPRSGAACRRPISIPLPRPWREPFGREPSAAAARRARPRRGAT